MHETYITVIFDGEVESFDLRCRDCRFRWFGLDTFEHATRIAEEHEQTTMVPKPRSAPG